MELLSDPLSSFVEGCGVERDPTSSTTFGDVVAESAVASTAEAGTALERVKRPLVVVGTVAVCVCVCVGAHMECVVCVCVCERGREKEKEKERE